MTHDGGSSHVQRFSISIPDADLAELRQRIRSTRWPDALDGGAWYGGADLGFMRRLAEYWTTTFDWRAQEAALNQLPQYLCDVDGTAIHFVHIKGRRPGAIPLMLIHGWPGTFAELLKLVPLLSGDDDGDAEQPAFDLVIPSIPGFAFSAHPMRPGMSVRRIAELFIRLMRRLGYDRFAAQGGDWGAAIATWMARLSPESLLGIHLNFLPGSYEPFVDSERAPATDEEEGFRRRQSAWREQQGAYGQLQRTTPQTPAYALNDSPIGLAAWIAEKLRWWTDCAGDLEASVSLDELLTNICIYWFSASIGSSMHLYQESSGAPLHLAAGEKIRPPTAFASFPKDVWLPPRQWIERGYNLTHFTEMPRGGHFAALEEPALLAADIRSFFDSLDAGARGAGHR